MKATMTLLTLCWILAVTNVTPGHGQQLLYKSNTCLQDCNPGTWESLAIAMTMPSGYSASGVPSSQTCNVTVYLRRKICQNIETGKAKVVIYFDGACSDCPIHSAEDFLETIIRRSLHPENPLGAFVNTIGMTTTVNFVTRGCWSRSRNCGEDNDKYCLYQCDCNPANPSSNEGNCWDCCLVESTVRVGALCDVSATTPTRASFQGDCIGAIRPDAKFLALGCEGAVDIELQCTSACPFDRPSR